MTLIVAAIVAALALPAAAQFPDALSKDECPGCAAAVAHEAFEGTWSTALTTALDSRWALEDFFCFAACTAAGRATAARLLTDANEAGRSALDLYPVAVAANVRSVTRLLSTEAHVAHEHATNRAPGLSCERPNLAEQLVSPLPLAIERRPDRLVLRYEELGAERTVFLDGRVVPPPDEALPLGLSKGRFEHGALVIETSRVPAGRLSGWIGGVPHSAALRVTERYSLGVDGVLDLVLELDDPKTFTQPLVVTKRWLRGGREGIAHYRCDVMSAGLGGPFAEYIDPRGIDARRRASRSPTTVR